MRYARWKRLTGVSAAEIMDAQRAIETLGAELAAENATPQDIEKLRRLLREAEAAIGDLDEFTRLSRDFHLAVAEASHNRVILVQLISLEHVSWPRRNVTATPKLASHILEIHTKLADLIELRDPSGAVGNAYGLTGLPTTFVLDPSGNIVQTLPGPQTVASLRRALGSVD